MRHTENRTKLKESMTTTVEVEGRAQLLQHTFDALKKSSP